jgi:hypothetical protein
VALGDDDFLCHASKWLITSVTQFSQRHLNGTLMVRHHQATKSASTSPNGVVPMSIIIFIIALTFSVRYGASAAGAVVQIAEK